MNILEKFILSWKFIVLIVSLFFLLLYKKPLSELINKETLNKLIKYLEGKKTKNQIQTKSPLKKEIGKIKKFYSKIGVKSFDEFYQGFSLYVKTSEQTKNTVKELELKNNNLFNLWRNYMLAYFNLFLVFNSKQALFWFYKYPNSTKEVFINNFSLFNKFIDEQNQKEIIFNVLLQNSLLIKDDRNLFSISNIGIDFLKFIGFIKQL